MDVWLVPGMTEGVGAVPMECSVGFVTSVSRAAFEESETFLSSLLLSLCVLCVLFFSFYLFLLSVCLFLSPISPFPHQIISFLLYVSSLFSVPLTRHSFTRFSIKS